MWLTVDAGNSRIKLALFGDDQAPMSVETLPTNGDPDEYRRALSSFAGASSIERIGIAAVSATPALDRVFDELVPATPRLRVQAGLRLPINNTYETPTTLGADRLASAVGAWVIYGRPAERPTVVVDAGTAVTYEVVTRDGTFIGGAIAPGPRLQLDALNRGTAQLPRLEDIESRSPVGASTRAAIEAGVLYGFVDSVSGMLRRIEHDLGEIPLVVLTGGWSAPLSPSLMMDHVVNPHLVLKGVRILMEDNP